MSDELNEEGTPIVPEKKPGLLSTPTGKVVAVVVGLGILGIVAGVAVAIVLYVFGNQAVDQLEGQLQEPAGESTPGSTVSTGTIVAEVPVAEAPAAKVPNSEVFTFRDIFVPLLKPASAVTSAVTGEGGTLEGGTTTADTLTPTTGGTLYLDGVITEDGVMKAQLRFNGASYSLGAGEAIPGSPWQVLRVSQTSVVMLYGDIQVTLAVGEGITK